MSTREELTRQAEKSLRQGRMDDAIALYQDLANLTPVDWGIVKQLADLLERAGQHEAAAAQFSRWGDHLFAEGFHSKAAALYKKVLKLDSSHEHALWQLGDVSLELKLRADARLAFQRVVDLRQRRGDAAGAAVARERLASLEGGAPPPGRAGLVGLTPPPAPVREPSAATPPPPHRAVETPSAGAQAPALPGAAPPAPGVAIASPASAETADARLARLRREAQAADDVQATDAEFRWGAVLAADPHDVATRLRLVRRAIDAGELEKAERLALPLDATEAPALDLLVELAWRRGRGDALGRLIAGRVHAGAPPAHVLTPVEALATRLPDAARAALAAAVSAWCAARQPGHAVAALEQAEARGLLRTELYLRWVEICVDAGLAGLSRAQSALARAYVGEARVAEARAVAEDVFVREGGAEPYRALLLDVLDRLGERDPHRVLVDLLTPPSEVVEEVAAEVEPVLDGIVDVDLDAPLPTTSAPVLAEIDRLLPRWASTSGDRRDAAVGQTNTVPPAPDLAFVTPRSAAPPSEPIALSAVLVDAESTAAHVDGPSTTTGTAVPNASFDWSFLLGRDVEDPPVSPAPDVVEPVQAADEDSIDPGGAGPSDEGDLWSPPAAATESVFEQPATEAATLEPLARPLAEPSVGVDADLAPFVEDEAPRAQDEPSPPAAVVEVPCEPEADAPEPPLEPLVEAVPPTAADAETGARPDGDADAIADTSVAAEPAAAVRLDAPASPLPEPPLPAAEGIGAPEHDPYEVPPSVDPVLARIAAAQPIMAASAETLPPTFNVPSSWFSEQPGTASDRQRQRHPEDAYLFEDDDSIPTRWGRRPAAPLTPPAAASARLDRDVSVPSEPVLPPAEPLPAQNGEERRPAPAPSDSESDDRSPAEPEAAGSEGDVVDEEIDLTQLLEELRQFDTVLPDPRPRAMSAHEETPGGSAAPAGETFADADAELPASGRASSLADFLKPPPAPVDAPQAPSMDGSAAADEATAELDAAFADLHRDTDDRLVAEQQLAAGRVFLAAGLVSEAARAFERASLAPRSRFEAAQALAELHRSRGQLPEAVRWYEYAAMAPVPDAAVTRPVLYDLAESLEALGENDRALGVLLDLLSQVEDYRDARARLDRLLRVDAGG